MRYVTRPAADGSGGSCSEADRTGCMRELYPAVGEYLTSTSWSATESRETSTLTFFTEGGAWKCCLHDRDRGLTLWRTGATFEALLASLEATLEEGGGDWRQDRKGGKSR